MKQKAVQEALLPSFSLDVLEEKAIDTIRLYAPKGGPYYGAFSGGKDSVVLKHVTEKSGVDVVWHYNVTTIDPPELVKFIRREHPDVVWKRSKRGNFFSRMAQKGYPTRKTRWCCQEYKEMRTPEGARLLVGIRAAESPRRARDWKVFTYHSQSRDYAVSPLLHWSDQDIWEYIGKENISYCELYDEGFKRLGCIGCPMGRKESRIRELARWPRYARKWKQSFKKIWDRRTGTLQRNGRPWFGDVFFRDYEDMFEWWVTGDALPDKLEDAESDGCQMALDLWS